MKNFRLFTISAMIILSILMLNKHARAQTDTIRLKDVHITGKKQIIRQQADRLVYDLQADPESKGKSTLEMMRKVPFVSLDADQNILLKNSSNFKIFIDGKPSGMLENNPKEVLRSLPASTIERIEVMINPPAKYDAEGFAGIINIVTYKKAAEGYNGTLNFSESFPAGGPGGGGSFSLKSGKLRASVFAGVSGSGSPATDSYLTRNTWGSGAGNLMQSGNNKSSGRTGYLGSEMSYEINLQHLISAQFSFNRNKNSRLENQSSSLEPGTGPLQAYDLFRNSDSRSSNAEAALNYQISSKKKKSKLLTFSYRYAYFSSDDEDKLEFIKTTNYPGNNFLQQNKYGSDEHTAQADYQDKFNKWSLESGIKAILRSNRSDFGYKSTQVTEDHFGISQDVFSAYTSIAYNNGKNIGIKAGLRAEQTSMRGDISRNYLNVVPSLSFAYQLKGGDQLSLGFSQRLKRPGINRLNPFIDRSQPNSESTGNPELKVSTINNIIAGYSHSGKVSVNLGAGYSLFNDLDFRIFSYDQETRLTKSTFENVGRGSAISLDLTMSYSPLKSLGFDFNGNLTHIDIKTTEDVIPHTRAWYHNFTLSANYRPIPSWRLAASLNVIGKNPASRTFQSITAGQINTAFSSSHELIKGKLNLMLSLNNPFRKFRIMETTTSGYEFTELSGVQSYFRNYKVSLNYTFGRLKDQVKKTKKGIKNDDVSN